MSTEQNKSAVRRFIQQGWSDKDPAAFEAFFAPDIVHHAMPPGIPAGVEGVKQYASMFQSAFPDAQVTVDLLTAEGDKVAYHWTSQATHTGNLMGIPPTGKKITVSGIAIDRFEGGKSVEHWEVIDQMGMMQQLGVVPSE